MVAPDTPRPVVCDPEPRSRTIFQSQVVLLQTVSQPLPWLSQTIWPPATQWSRFFGSDRYGAMNLGFGSHGFGSNSMAMNAAHVGVIVVYDRVVSSERPPFW